MKILKLNKKKEKIFTKKCKECGTKFQYTSADLETDRDGGSFIFCPHCKSFILIKSASYEFVDRANDC